VPVQEQDPCFLKAASQTAGLSVAVLETDAFIDPFFRHFYNRTFGSGDVAMHVVINGKDEDIQPDLTVAQLVAGCQFQPTHVAVEINEDLVPRKAFANTRVAEGDQIEIVTFVGGG
jgi:thiamine biosynthesis protein ThiS